MTPRLVVRPEAEADIDEAYAWYEDRVTGLGDQFLDAVGESIAVIVVPGSCVEPLRANEIWAVRELVTAV